MKIRFLVTMIAIFGFIAAACGSTDDGISAGATATEVVEAVEADAVPSGEQASAEDLIGTWRMERGTTWDISAETIGVTGGAVSSFSYEATATTIELIDADCTAAQVGIYEWEIVEDELALTLVDDPCSGRGSGLGGVTFERLP